MKAAVFAAAFALAGCVGISESFTEFPGHLEAMIVELVLLDDQAQLCAVAQTRGINVPCGDLRAMATFGGVPRCQVFLLKPRDLNHLQRFAAELYHELGHCQNGRWHR
jgi:hypothetical protein